MTDTKTPATPAPEERVLAPSLLRITAFSIDLTIMMVLLGSARIFLLPNHWEQLSFQATLPGYILAIALALLALVFKDMVMGRSLGKVFLNLYVAQVQDGLPVATPGQLFKRNLWMLIFPVEAFKMVFDSHFRRFGDHFAGTMVVQIKRPPVVRRFTTKVVGGLLVLAVIWSLVTSSTESMLKKRADYQLASTAVLVSEKVYEATGQIQSVGDWFEANRTLDPEKGEVLLYIFEVKGAKATRKVQVAMTNASGTLELLQISVLAPEGGETETESN